MGIQINGQTDTISATDGALNIGGTVTVNVTGDATGLTGTPDITVGTVNASSAVISGDLTVQGTTTTLDTLLTEVDRLEVGANNSTVGVAITQSGSGDILRLYDGASQVVTVKDGGSVGIGTEDPTKKLTVYGSDTELIRLTQAVDPGTQQEYGIGFAANLNHTHPAAQITYKEFDASDSRSNLLFYTRGDNADSAPTERLRITSSGNVGIGTDNPQTSLVVERDWVNNYGSINIKSSSDVLSGIGFRTDGGYAGGFIYRDGTTGNFFELNAQGSRDIRALLNGTETLRITSSGNVGINSTTPTSYGNSQTTLVIEDDTNPAICISDTGQEKDWWIVGLGDGLGIRYADGGGSGSASNVTSSAFFGNEGRVQLGSVTMKSWTTGGAGNGVTLTKNLIAFNETNSSRVYGEITVWCARSGLLQQRGYVKYAIAMGYFGGSYYGFITEIHRTGVTGFSAFDIERDGDNIRLTQTGNTAASGGSITIMFMGSYANGATFYAT
jgi:hypothetical protein